MKKIAIINQQEKIECLFSNLGAICIKNYFSPEILFIFFD